MGSYGFDLSLNPSLNPNCVVELGFKSSMLHTISGLWLTISFLPFISARNWYWVVLRSYDSDPSLNPSLNPNYSVKLGFNPSSGVVVNNVSNLVPPARRRAPASDRSITPQRLWLAESSAQGLQFDLLEVDPSRRSLAVRSKIMWFNFQNWESSHRTKQSPAHTSAAVAATQICAACAAHNFPTAPLHV